MKNISYHFCTIAKSQDFLNLKTKLLQVQVILLQSDFLSKEEAVVDVMITLVESCESLMICHYLSPLLPLLSLVSSPGLPDPGDVLVNVDHLLLDFLQSGVEDNIKTSLDSLKVLFKMFNGL